MSQWFILLIFYFPFNNIFASSTTSFSSKAVYKFSFFIAVQCVFESSLVLVLLCTMSVYVSPLGTHFIDTIKLPTTIYTLEINTTELTFHNATCSWALTYCRSGDYEETASKYNKSFFQHVYYSVNKITYNLRL